MDQIPSPYKPILLIAMLGGRIQPAAVTALQLSPDALVCIASKDRPGAIDQLRGVWSALGQRSPILDARCVAPMVPDEAKATVDRFVASYAEHRPMISLTGAPMPMVLGAYHAAQEHNCPALYLNTGDGTLVDFVHVAAKRPVEISLTVEEFVVTHGATLAACEPVGRGEQIPERHRKVLAAMRTHMPHSMQTMAWLNAGPNLGMSVSRRWSLGREHWVMMEEFVQQGVIRGLQRRATNRGDVVSFQVPNSVDGAFLNGKWLEQYVYTEACASRQDGEPLFDDCAFGVKIVSNKALRELDFVGVRRATGVIASCKTGKRAFNKDYVNEIVTVGKGLGDNYTPKLFISGSACGNDAFLRQAHTREVVVVAQDQLACLADVLRRESMSPTFARL